MNVHIVLADDHQLLREGLRNLLDSQPDMEVVGEAANGREAIELVGRLSPHVVLMDVSMPEVNGIEATARIAKEFSETRVIALSIHSEKHLVDRMIRAGASAYLMKNCAFDELVLAIRSVLQGKTYLSPEVAGILVDGYLLTRAGNGGPNTRSLTLREREILQQIAEGMSTKDIARRLEVSVKTVETHRRQMMGKLKIGSVAELTKYAIREGLTTL
jgi:DNA-binding NarL/FixJ family response regulator